MASLFSQLIEKIKGKKKRVIHLRPEDMTDDEKLEAVKNSASYWRGKYAKLESELAKQRDSEQSKEKEKEKIKDLIEQSRELKKKEYVSTDLFKVFKLIEKQKKLKPENKLQFTTFDGKLSLGIVDTITFSPTGMIECVSKGNVIWAGHRLNQVFYWVSGLNNFIKKGIIPLCVNENGQFTPNIMQEEVPQYVLQKNGKFKLNRVNTKEVSKYIAELEEEKSEVYRELGETEELVAEQNKEINEKDRESKVHKSRADKIQSELSMALNKVAELDRANGMIVRQNTLLYTLKESNEELVEKLEQINKDLMVKLEEKGSSTTRNIVTEEMQQLIQFVKNNLGNITQVIQPEKEQTSILENVRPKKA